MGEAIFVLQSAQYPVISFQPTDIEGIPPEDEEFILEIEFVAVAG